MKKGVFFIIIIVIIACSLSLFMGYTQVIYAGSGKKDTATFHKGEIVSPLKEFDFDKGNWKAYLIIDKDDRGSLPAALRKANCFVTSDVRVLKGMQKDWKMAITGGM